MRKHPDFFCARPSEAVILQKEALDKTKEAFGEAKEALNDRQRGTLRPSKRHLDQPTLYAYSHVPIVVVQKIEESKWKNSPVSRKLCTFAHLFIYK